MSQWIYGNWRSFTSGGWFSKKPEPEVKKKWLIRFIKQGMMSNWYTAFTEVVEARTKEEVRDLINDIPNIHKRLANHGFGDYNSPIGYMYNAEEIE